MQHNPTAGVLAHAWALYRMHWSHLVGIAFVVYAIAGMASVVLTSALGWFGAVAASVITLIGAFWVQGALVKAVDDVRDGRVDLSLRTTLDRVRPHLAAIAVASVLAGLAIALGLLLLIIPGLFLMTIWSVLVPVIVLENRSAFESFGRSMELVRGYGWPVFSLIFLTFLISFAFGSVLHTLLSPLNDSLQRFLADLVSGAVVVPFMALIWTLLYFRLRDAKSSEQPPAQPLG